MQYNAHVNEEQLSHTLVDYIKNEIKNKVIEILPKIIFYFNPQSPIPINFPIN